MDSDLKLSIVGYRLYKVEIEVDKGKEDIRKLRLESV